MNKKIDYGLIYLIFLIFTSSVLLFTLSDKDQVDSKILVQSKKLDLYVTNKVPISDYTARNFNFDTVDKGIVDEASFTVSSSSSSKTNYAIYFEEDVDALSIEAKYIKVLLFDEDGKEYNLINGSIPTVSDLPGSVDYPQGRKLYVGSLDEGTIKDFIVRIWVSDGYLTTKINRDFRARVVIKNI